MSSTKMKEENTNYSFLCLNWHLEYGQNDVNIPFTCQILQKNGPKDFF